MRSRAPASRAKPRRFLQTDRSAREHASRCHLGIAVAEYGVAWQHALPHPFGESCGPARWSLRVTNDEGMGDGFRLHEKIGDNAAVEIIRRMNAETRCLVQQQGVVRHEKERAGIVVCRIVVPPKLIAL